MRILCQWFLLVLVALLPPALVAQEMTAPPSAQPQDEVEEPDSGDDTGIAPLPSKAPPPAAAVTAPSTMPAGAPTAPVPPPAARTDFNAVSLRVLNKVTARSESLDAPIGSAVRFGTIEIIAHRCWQAAPGEQPENAALIEISEVKPAEAPARIFFGWMFSSSPGLSALENPFYDVAVIQCATVTRE